MGPNERFFKLEYAGQLFRLASEDLRSARILFKGAARPEDVLFHVQQSIEKSLKAVLCSQGAPVPLSHDLSLLIDRLRADPPPGGMSLADLTPFATVRRYEEGMAVLTAQEIQSSLAAAEAVLAWAKAKSGDHS